MKPVYCSQLLPVNMYMTLLSFSNFETTKIIIFDVVVVVVGGEGHQFL